ncbi:unnamed protein product [Eruca vesicaria subsp. sativa]|uniref:Uncharacterized protein n=1 Tax=Eruca vesicaria subsp. sativa TaxID=29727 RepID=A0ABC8LIV9_ERUVS|nr:unnamed protein product [Eruca vesicaria subsp. sativa]
MSDSDEEKMAIPQLQPIRQRRRPPHSKRRDSRASAEMNSTWDNQEMMILKQAAANKGVKQMASTAYLSESEEEAMIMAQEQSIRFLKEVTDTDLEIEGSLRRKPPHLARRSSRDSSLLPKMMWYKPQNRLFMNMEESDRAHDELLLFLDSLLKAKEEAIVLQQPSQGLEIQN